MDVGVGDMGPSHADTPVIELKGRGQAGVTHEAAIGIDHAADDGLEPAERAVAAENQGTLNSHFSWHCAQ